MMTLVAWMGPVLEVGILVGLILRRRLQLALTLPLLLVTLGVADVVSTGYPASNTWDFWLAREFVHAALFLLLALELGHKAFADKRAQRAAARWIAVVAIGAALLVATAPPGQLIVGVLPRLMGALAWLYLGLAVVMLRYNARIEPLHDAILSGFAPYLIVYALTWSQASESTRAANIVNPIVFAAVLLLLLYTAWQPLSQAEAPWLRRLLRPGTRRPRRGGMPRSACVADLRA